MSLSPESQNRRFRMIPWAILAVLFFVFLAVAWFVLRSREAAPLTEVVPEQRPLQINQRYQSQNGLFELSLPEGWSYEESSNTPLQTTLTARGGTYSLELTYITSDMNLSAIPQKVCDFSDSPAEGAVGLGLGRLFATDVREFAQSSVPREATEGQPAAVWVCSRPLGGDVYTFGWVEAGIVSLRYLNSTGVLTEGDLAPLYGMLETLNAR